MALVFIYFSAGFALASELARCICGLDVAGVRLSRD